MHTYIETHVRADPRRVFDLAARVEDWPRILPHYRWVHVQDGSSATERRVAMAARRNVVGSFGIPVQWVSIQRLDSARGLIEFEHIGGVTRGMQVVWNVQPESGGTLASIQHVFAPAWPVPEGLLQAVIGEYFVNGVARRTLRCISQLAEADKIRL